MAHYCAVFAHPDDESFGVGGTLALLSATATVDVICCTDGNHQDKNLKTQRVSELDTASKLLGINNVYRLDFSDGYLCNAQYHQLVDQLRLVLDQLRPEVLLTFHPNGYSGHLDHIAVTSVVNYLFPSLDYVQELWYATRVYEPEPGFSYFVYQPPAIPADQTHKVIDVSSVWATKQQAIRAHASQTLDCERVIAQLDRHPKLEHFLVRSKSA